MTSAGTFTSCKDYDDDINNLQEQIDKLATKEDMEAKLSQMQSAIDAAKATADEALAKAEAAGDSEEVNKLKERVAALEEAMAKVEELKSEIKTMVDEQLAEFRVEMQEFMKEVEELTGYSLTMITEISFVQEKYEDYRNPINNPLLNYGYDLDPNLDVNYARISVKVPKIVGYSDDANNYESKNSYEFGKGFTGAFTVNNGDVNTVKDNMLVKVAPVDAVISSEMVSLINGEGANLNDFVEITATPWSGSIINTRANTKTGLYNIGVQLKKDVDFEAFDKMVLPVPGDHDPDGCKELHHYNMFAVAVSDSEKSRTVTSDYKVTLHVQKEKEAKTINESSTISAMSLSSTQYASNPINKYANGDQEDAGCAEIKLGSDFYINVRSTGGDVMASYVIVDMDNESLTTTDKVAIESLNIKGLNEVTKSKLHTLSISGASGVAVPLKLVTIDYTGIVKYNTIWVKAGEGVETVSAFNIVPSLYVADATNWSANEVGSKDLQEFTIPDGTAKCQIEFTIGESNGSINQTIVTYSSSAHSEFFNLDADEDGKLDAAVITVNGASVLKLYKADKKEATVGTPLKDVAYAAFIGNLNLQSMREDKAYVGEIKFYNDDQYVGARLLSVTKKLPTDVPAGFSAKTNTIVNGVMTVYPEPIIPDPNNDKQGYYLLTESFNNWNETIKDADKGFGFVIKGITDTNDSDNQRFATYVEEGTAYTPLIDDIKRSKIGEADKKYPAVVKYNYGDIKFIPAGHGVDANANHTVEWSNKFDMRIAHWIKDSKFQWTLGENPVVTYGEENTIYGKVTTNSNGVITSVENVIEVIAPNGAEINPFDGTNANKWNTFANNFGNGDAKQNVEIILKTVGEDGTERTNEFFNARFHVDTHSGYNTPMTTILLTPVTVSEGTTVGNDVETKVYFKFTDKFGIDHNIHALTFTMKYKKN